MLRPPRLADMAASVLRDDERMSEGFDVPLFREIQKLLASSTGPINFELARQTAIAVVSQHGADRNITADDRNSFAEAVHRAEGPVAGYSRLPLADAPATAVLRRSEWVTQTLDAWRWVLERLAQRFTADIKRLGIEAEAEAGGSPLGMGIEQVAPLLFGLQTGMLIGHLATEALGRHDFPIPRDDEGHLFYVVANIDDIASGYEFDPADLKMWLALHDVAREAALRSQPWIVPYFRALLTDLIDAVEIDVSELERRLSEIQGGGIESLQEGFVGQSPLPLVETDHYRAAATRLRSFLAALEGYAGHIGGVVGRETVAGYGRIDEGMARRAASPTQGKAFLAGVLGIPLDRALERSGETFAAAVVKMKGPTTLNRVWDAPDNLPSPDEIKDPFQWMERVAD